MRYVSGGTLEFTRCYLIISANWAFEKDTRRNRPCALHTVHSFARVSNSRTRKLLVYTAVLGELLRRSTWKRARSVSCHD